MCDSVVESEQHTHGYNTRNRATRTVRKTKTSRDRIDHRYLREDNLSGPVEGIKNSLSKETAADSANKVVVTVGGERSKSESEVNRRKRVSFEENLEDARDIIAKLRPILSTTSSDAKPRKLSTQAKPILKHSLSLPKLPLADVSDNVPKNKDNSTTGDTEVRTAVEQAIGVQDPVKPKKNLSGENWGSTELTSSSGNSEQSESGEDELSSPLDTEHEESETTAQEHQSFHPPVAPKDPESLVTPLNSRALVPYKERDSWYQTGSRLALLSFPRVRLADLAGVINNPDRSEAARPIEEHCRTLPLIPTIRTTPQQNTTPCPENQYSEVTPRLTYKPQTREASKRSKSETRWNTLTSHTSIGSSTFSQDNFASQNTSHPPAQAIPIHTGIKITTPSANSTILHDQPTAAALPKNQSTPSSPANTPSPSPATRTSSPVFYSDDEMAYTTPSVFRGTSQENAVGWLRHAKWWLDTTRAGTSQDLGKKLHQLAVLFQDEAENWFANLRIRQAGTDGSSTSGVRLGGNDGDGTSMITSWDDFESNNLVP